MTDEPARPDVRAPVDPRRARGDRRRGGRLPRRRRRGRRRSSTRNLTAQIDAPAASQSLRPACRPTAPGRPARFEPPPPADPGRPYGPPFARLDDRAPTATSVTDARDAGPAGGPRRPSPAPQTATIDGTRRCGSPGARSATTTSSSASRWSTVDDAQPTIILGRAAHRARSCSSSCSSAPSSIGRRVAAPIEARPPAPARVHRRRLARAADAAVGHRGPHQPRARAGRATPTWYRTALRARRPRVASGCAGCSRTCSGWPGSTPTRGPARRGAGRPRASSPRRPPTGSRSSPRRGTSRSTSHVPADEPSSSPLRRSWLDRLLGVLLDNACKYAPEGGTVDRHGRRATAARVASPSTTPGPGIPDDERAAHLRPLPPWRPTRGRAAPASASPSPTRSSARPAAAGGSALARRRRPHVGQLAARVRRVHADPPAAGRSSRALSSD